MKSFNYKGPESLKDLGLTFVPKLLFITHLHNITGDSLSVFGFFKRFSKEFTDIYV